MHNRAKILLRPGLVLLLTLLSCGPTAAARGISPAEIPKLPTFAAISQLQSRGHGQSFPQKAIKIAANLLERPYQERPCGEGPIGRFDQFPAYRLDAFSNQSYLVTVLALAGAENAAQFPTKNAQLRYNKTPQYRHRWHDPLAGLLPRLEQLGLITAITQQLAPLTSRIKSKFAARTFFRNLNWEHLRIYLTEPMAASRRLKELQNLGARLPTRHAQTAYIPQQKLKSQLLWPKKPLLVAFVYPVSADDHASVVYLGLVAWERNQHYLYHTGPQVQKTTKEPLLEFLARQADQTNPFLGAAIYRLGTPMF